MFHHCKHHLQQGHLRSHFGHCEFLQPIVNGASGVICHCFISFIWIANSIKGGASGWEVLEKLQFYQTPYKLGIFRSVWHIKNNNEFFFQEYWHRHKGQTCKGRCQVYCNLLLIMRKKRIGEPIQMHKAMQLVILLRMPETWKVTDRYVKELCVSLVVEFIWWWVLMSNIFCQKKNDLSNIGYDFENNVFQKLKLWSS